MYNAQHAEAIRETGLWLYVSWFEVFPPHASSSLDAELRKLDSGSTSKLEGVLTGQGGF